MALLTAAGWIWWLFARSETIAHDAEVHSNLGIALADKGQINEAIRQYQEALRNIGMRLSPAKVPAIV